MKMITGITTTNISAQMYKKTKSQAKKLGKKLPKDIKKSYKDASKYIEELTQSPNAVYKGVNKDTINYFEPKTNNRWLVTFPDDLNVEKYFVKSIVIPNYSMDISNNVLQVSLYNPVNLSLSKIFTDVMTSNTKFKLKLDLLDATGIVLEKWKFKNCDISSINFGKLDYKDDSTSTIDLFIRFENLKIKI